jgi:hypothetical protein
MPKSFDIRSLIKAREDHSKEVGALETAIKEAVNNAVDGMEMGKSLTSHVRRLTSSAR